MNQQTVEQVLDEFTDPETGRGLVALEQVRDLKLSDGRLALTLALTTFSAPLWSQTRADLVEHLRSRLPQLSEVDIELAEHHRPPQKLGEIGLEAKAVIAVGSGKGSAKAPLPRPWPSLARAGARSA